MILGRITQRVLAPLFAPLHNFRPIALGYRRSAVMAALLFLPTCSSYSAGDQQVIYIPTENGVVAERVSTGSKSSNSGELASDQSSNSPANTIAGLEILGPVGQAISQLIRYDIGSSECLRRHYSSTTGGADLDAAYRCFDNIAVPASCEGLRSPIARLVNLSVADRSYDALLPSLSSLQRRCGVSLADYVVQPDQREQTILDVAIIFSGRGDSVANLHFQTSHFLSRLCERVLGANWSSSRVADMLLCARISSGGPLRGRDYYLERIEGLGEN